jgi:hypothetical protein
MHNLKTNFDKFMDIAKLSLSTTIRPDGNFERYRNPPKLSDIEVVALSIAAESLGIDSENLLFSKLRKEYAADFPRLINRCNFNRRRRRLQDAIAIVAEFASKKIGNNEKEFIIDSIPVPICQNVRIPRVKICREDSSIQPARGYHASHKQYFFGFKMQLVITKQGVPFAMGFSPANTHDTAFLDQLPHIQLTDCDLIGDKGYLSTGRQTALFENERIRLITPLRENMKRKETLWNPAYRYTRKRIETLFSQLCDQMFIKRNYAKTLNGLFARMCSKISAVAVLQYINFVNKKPINHLKHALAA